MIPIISLLFEILRMVLLIRIVLSWLPHNRYHPLINIVKGYLLNFLMTI